MARGEFEEGLPKKYIGRDDNSKALQVRYGNFAVAVLLEVKKIDSKAPDDILTFGENWFQLVETRDQPVNDAERMLQRQHVDIFKDLPFERGLTLFGDVWPIKIRDTRDNIYELMRNIQEGVCAGSLRDRILRKLAVLDLASENPPLRDQFLAQKEETPWGSNGLLVANGVLIYHIRSGFARQSVQDILGSPESDLSASIHKYQGRKWE